MTTKELDKLLDTLECPECKSELSDQHSVTQQISWLECEECGFNYIYEKG